MLKKNKRKDSSSYNVGSHVRIKKKKYQVCNIVLYEKFIGRTDTVYHFYINVCLENGFTYLKKMDFS